MASEQGWMDLDEKYARHDKFGANNGMTAGTTLTYKTRRIQNRNPARPRRSRHYLAHSCRGVRPCGFKD